MPFITLLLFGILSACFALLFEVGILSIGKFTDPTFSPIEFTGIFTLFLVAAIEEISKFAFMRQYTKRFLSLGSIDMKTVLVLGFLFGLGFAIPEIALSFQFLSLPSLLPLVGVLALHIVTSILFAFFIIRKKDALFPSFLPVFGLIITIHLLYNLAISRVF